MKGKILLLIAATMAALVLVSGVALAAAFEGTPARDVVYGTPAADYIATYGGDDTIVPRGGRDTASGGPGNDRINVAGDQAKDTVYCGTGEDTLVANPHDRVGDTPASEVVQQGLTTACEKVSLRP
jgi:Ca2+-binding RTX toxin-like protein